VGERRARFEAREAFFTAAGEVTPYVAVEVGEEVFFVATDDTGVGRRVFVRGKRRDMTTLANGLAELAARGIRPPADPVFVEVGANMGTTTVMALRRHGFASAVALEPSPQNAWLCRLNLVANGLERLAHKLFVRVRSVHFGRIEERHPGIDGRPDNRDAILAGRWASVALADPHTPETERRHLQAVLT